MPKYVPYAAFKEQTEKENATETAFEDLLAEAKTQLTDAAAKLGRLAGTPETARNSEVLPTATLQQLQRLAVRNSLNVAKLRMMKAKVGELSLVIDAANSMPMCPAFELQTKASK